MARRTYKQIALDTARDMGITVDMSEMGGPDYIIILNGLDAKMADGGTGEAHSIFVHREDWGLTESAWWRGVCDALKGFETCECDECHP